MSEHRILEIEREVQEETLKARGDDLKAMTALYLAVSEMMLAGGWTVGKRGNPHLTLRVMMELLTKAIKTFRSVQILCACGRNEDAKVLVRMLLETYVAVLFILRKKRGQRAVVYHAYSLSQDLKMLNEWKTTKGLKRSAPKAMTAKIQAALDKVTEHLPPTVNYWKHWSGENSLKDAVKSLRIDSLYASVYRHTSAFAHASDVGAHLSFEAGSDEPVYQIFPRIDGFDGVSFGAREIFWLIAHEIDSKIGLGFEATLAPHRLTRAFVEARTATRV